MRATYASERTLYFQVLVIRAFILSAQFHVHEFGFTSRSQSVEHQRIDAGEADLFALPSCKWIHRHMEILNRQQGVINKYLDREILPAENVVELVPFVLLLLQEKHRVHFPVYLEVLVVAQPCEEYSLVSYNWRLILQLLFISNLNYVSSPFEQFDVACIHLWCRSPAVVRQMLVLVERKLEEETIIEGSKAVNLLVYFQRIAFKVLFEVGSLISLIK